MAELQMPDIAGNFLSSYYTAQQKQQADADRQRNMMRQDQGDEMARQKHALEIGQQVVDLLGSTADGDEAGFERAKMRWGQMGLPPEAVAGFTVADLPMLRQKAGTQLRELQLKNAALAPQLTQAQIAATNRSNRPQAGRGPGGLGGGGMPGGKAPPEWAAKDMMFLKRGIEANNGFTPEATKALTQSAKDWMARGLGEYNTGLGNIAQSKESRQASQVAKNFVAIVLRKDTGAAVTPQEFDFYKDIFIPQYGDDDGTLQLKATARSTFLSALGSGLSHYQALQSMNITPPEGLLPSEGQTEAPQDGGAAAPAAAGAATTFIDYDANGNRVSR